MSFRMLKAKTRSSIFQHSVHSSFPLGITGSFAGTEESATVPFPISWQHHMQKANAQ